MPNEPSPRHRRKAGGRRARPPKSPVVESTSRSQARPRLQKLLASAGIASRRGAENLIRTERVTVNGRTAKLGDRASPTSDRVELDGERLILQPLRYWIVHKPKGVLTTRRDPEGRRTIVALLPRAAEGLFPVGRLDLETEGLVLLTNDGDLAHTLLHPSLRNEREYRVRVRGALDEKSVRRIERGMRLEDGKTAPASVHGLRVDAEGTETHFSLVIKEGKKRQVRRMMRALRHPVLQLIRVRVGPVKLGRLGVGESRSLRRDELRALLDHAEKLAGDRDAQERPLTRGRSSDKASQKPSRKPKA